MAYGTKLTYKRSSTGVKYFYPQWAIAVGWIVACSSVVMVPVVMIYYCLKTPGTLAQVSEYLT